MGRREDLELFKKYTGSTSEVLSVHTNQNYEDKFSAMNKNIQINTNKLRDFVNGTNPYTTNREG